MWSVPIFQMRETTFASGSERKTNHVPLHHAGCFMAGVPLHLASASVKSLTEHHANKRSGSGECSSAQLHLRSNGANVEENRLPWRCEQTSADERLTLKVVL